MKTAIVIGGSNGIGLAITNNLMSRDYNVKILDCCKPVEAELSSKNYEYHYCNLLHIDEDEIVKISKDDDISVLMITAGIGRIADFEYFHTAEVEKILTIDTVSTIKIIRLFYNRIKSKVPFYTGIMGSISGWMSSPSASVYAAAKAAVVRFVESVNIELEMAGTDNRILDISPASFKGSKFYGGDNDLSLTGPFAEEIIEHLFAHDTRFIPDYEDKFKDILERYHENPHEYGIHSYNYKKESGRLDNNKRVVIGYLSGTFDLFHVGHLNLLKRAKDQCDYLIVGVHDSGAWKGKETFIPFEERLAIVSACRYVDKAVPSCREDSDAWDLWHYDRLFVGSDYKGTERFQRYEEYFKDKGVKIVYFPYTKSTSSTHIRNAITLKAEEKNKE